LIKLPTAGCDHLFEPLDVCLPVVLFVVVNTYPLDMAFMGEDSKEIAKDTALVLVVQIELKLSEVCSFQCLNVFQFHRPIAVLLPS